MRLELTSLDGTTLRARTQRALEQVKEARQRAERMMRNELESDAARIRHTLASINQINNTAPTMWGGMGPQFDVSKHNGIGGVMVAYDEVIELLEAVLKK